MLFYLFYLILYLESPKHRLFHKCLNLGSNTNLSRPDSWSDPISESESVSGCEIIYWNSLPLFFFFFFFFRSELILMGIQTIFVITKNHLHIQKNYHRSGVHQNLYTNTKSHLLIETLIHIYVQYKHQRPQKIVLVSTYL